MRSFISLITGIVLSVIFVIYRIMDLLPAGPADKLVQLLILVPAVIAYSWFASGRIKGDLVVRIMESVSRPPAKVFLGILALLLLTFSIWMAYGPLEGIPKGGDEAAYFFQSKIFASGRLAAPRPAVYNPRAYFPFRHFIFRDNLWFIVYTPFHSILLAPFTAGGAAPLLGPLEGLVSLLGIFFLIRLWAGEKLARVATILLVLSPFFLFMTTTFMAHNTNLMLVTWSLFMISKRTKGGSLAYALAGGLLIGLAFCTKPYPVLVWGPYIALMVIIGCRGNRLRILVPVAAAAAVPVALFLVSNSYYTGNPLHTGYELVRGGSLIGFGPDKAWFPEYGDYAHTPLRGLLNIIRQFGTGSTILFGWPFISLVPLLLVLRRMMSDRRILWLILPILMFLPLMFLHYCPAIDYGPRHYFTFMPFVLTLTALGLKESVQMARRRSGLRGSNTVAAVAGGLFLVTLFLYMPEGIERRSGPWQTIDRQPERLALSIASTPAIVFMQAGQHGYPNIMSGVNFNSPLLDNEIIYCAHQTPGEDMRFMDAYPGRNPYLLWFDGERFHMEPWSEERSGEIAPTREMEYHSYSTEVEG